MRRCQKQNPHPSEVAGDNFSTGEEEKAIACVVLELWIYMEGWEMAYVGQGLPFPGHTGSQILTPHHEPSKVSYN